MAEKSVTSHQLFTAFIEAQRINRLSGGTVISPWDIEPGHDLEEWLEAAEALADLPSIRKRRSAEKQYLEKIRRAHPQYSRTHFRKH